MSLVRKPRDIDFYVIDKLLTEEEKRKFSGLIKQHKLDQKKGKRQTSKKAIELDVDFIGGEGPLTKKEEDAISEFIKTSKWRGEQQKLGKVKTPAKKKNLS